MKPLLRYLMLTLLGVNCCAVRAEPGASSQAGAIHQAVEQFLRRQSAGQPGTVSFKLHPVDPRVALPACPALDVFIPAGSRLWGQTTLGVRCAGPSAWTLYVTAEFRVTADYLVTTRPLAVGQILAASDLATQNGDLTRLPFGILTDAQQAIGKLVASPLAPGQPLRPDLLRAPFAVQQGQTVRLLSAGAGFHVSSEGRALNNAQEGQVSQVRTAAGQTVSGVARNGGSVEVSY